MKKALVILLLAIITGPVFAQTENRKITQVVVATYDGKSDRGYRFIDRSDDSTLLFSKIDPVLLKKFDLLNETSIGAAFRITFGTEKIRADSASNGKSSPLREELVILDLEEID